MQKRSRSWFSVQEEVQDSSGRPGRLSQPVRAHVQARISSKIGVKDGTTFAAIGVLIDCLCTPMEEAIPRHADTRFMSQSGEIGHPLTATMIRTLAVKASLTIYAFQRQCTLSLSTDPRTLTRTLATR